MASDIYVQAGEEAVIDLIDTWLSTTWQFQSGIGTTNAVKGNTALENTTGCPAKATPSSSSKTQPVADKIQCVGTIAYTGTLAITEFGWFGPGGTILLQRHTFAAINVVNGDSIEFTVSHEQA
jgi:hypothetical protein